MSAETLQDRLEVARRDLLDLTARNRLLNAPRESKRCAGVEIVDERSDAIFRLLVEEKKSLTFLPTAADDDDETAANGAGSHSRDDESGPAGRPTLDAQSQNDATADEDGEPEDAAYIDNGDVPAPRHRDLKLQTSHTSKVLQRKLLKLFYDARTFEEEQGVNILYLALGFLKWYEDDRSEKARYAPLILVPVRIDRTSVNARFRLRFTDEEISTNLSLQERLKVDFGLKLPELPEVDELSPAAYFEEVAAAVSQRRRWQVIGDDMLLWFFSFSKLLMYRDLQGESWPEERRIDQHDLIGALLQDGFQSSSPVCGDGESLDGILQPLDMTHVLDADSSQALAIEEMRRGRNLVIQGPPGTGKSQTIANMIATAVKEGQKVLFVAEKMAALEVVKRRLSHVGLGEMCLELHSQHANKRAVLEDLARTLHLGQPRAADVAGQAQQLQEHRDRLNRHVEQLHAPLGEAGWTPYRALGELVRLRAAGVPPADFQISSAVRWSAAELRERCARLEDLATHLRHVGEPRRHPWRGVQLEAVLPTDVDRWMQLLPPLIERLDALAQAAEQLAATLQSQPGLTALRASNSAQLAQRLLQAPPLDRRAINHPVWQQQRPAIERLIAAGRTWAESRAALDGVVAPIGWSSDVALARRHLAARGDFFLNFLFSDYRQSLATLRGILVGPAPKTAAQRVAILDRLIAGQDAQRTLESPEAQELGRRAFGSRWQGLHSDWPALQAVADWEAGCRQAGVPDNFFDVAAGLDDVAAVAPLLEFVRGHLKPVLTEIQSLCQALRLDPAAAFGPSDLRDVPLAAFAATLRGWQEQPETLPRWIAFHARWRKLHELDLSELAQRIDEAAIGPDDLLDRFQVGYCEALMRAAQAERPELAQFHGDSHEQVRRRFQELDQQRLEMARLEVALAHYQGLPFQGGDVGDMAIIRREIKKKRSHLPIRKLLAQAGHGVQAIKPVFMMSPISIAQFLEPGVLEFDLLLIDEASQVRPIEALGAIARARQVAVVGDDRQLPPTAFFDRMTGAEDDPEALDDPQLANLESILGLCESRNMPQRMLQWHYRSRHHSLIAVSNREFYDSRLYVVPSPYLDGEGGGLHFHHLPQAAYDRGGTRANQDEARTVAEAVLDHARRRPHLTLGVGAFSLAQRDAILDELELLRRSHPDLEPFFAPGGPEPFFVKNLESIQGDERDVIYISVGYGRDASGYFSMSFGPLNLDGGERRLNVLITRARESCHVFSSITDDDIDLNRVRGAGPAALKTFLHYARTGRLDVGRITGRDHDSPFEAEVARRLAALGYRVEAQVGVAGFFIDLAVVDPEAPGRYLLGIECDGAAYHSSRSARDRDRLRQQVLEDRGWIIHRIWSSDWFQQPEEQLKQLLAALDAARTQWEGRRSQAIRLASAGETGEGSPAAGAAAPLVERAHAIREQAAIERLVGSGAPPEVSPPRFVQPYEEADFEVEYSQPLHALRPGELAEVVVRIVAVEGPVHQEEITRRTATLWGLKRTGSRIQDAVDAALAEAAFRNLVESHGPFFSLAGQTQIPIRNREAVRSTNLRKPDFLPPREVRAALLATVQTHLGVGRDEVVTEVARTFGFRSTSGGLRQLIQDELRLLLAEELLEERHDKLFVRVQDISVESA